MYHIELVGRTFSGRTIYWFWRIRYKNGLKAAASETYKSKSSAKKVAFDLYRALGKSKCTYAEKKEGY